VGLSVVNQLDDVRITAAYRLESTKHLVDIRVSAEFEVSEGVYESDLIHHPELRDSLGYGSYAENVEVGVPLIVDPAAKSVEPQEITSIASGYGEIVT